MATSAIVRRHLRAAALTLLLLIVLAPGTTWARLVISRILVHGEHKTCDRALWTRMQVAPGDPIEFETLREVEQRLIESDHFSHVRVWIELPRDEAAFKMYVDPRDTPTELHVELVEKQSWFVVPIASFGSGDYAAGVAYGDQNLEGHDVQLVSAAQLGQSRSFIFAGFRDPLVVGAPLSWGVAGLARYELIRFFANHRQVMQVPTTIGGGEAELAWVLSPHLRVAFGLSARYQRVDSPEVREDVEPLPAYNQRSGRIFLLVFQAMYDNTIAPAGIRRGVRLVLKNEASDQFWGSQFDYSKFEGRTELYGKLSWNYPSLVLKTVFDFPTSSRGVPITEMLRIGGANLRGYFVNEFHGDTLVSAQLEDQVIAARDIRIPVLGARFNLAAAAFLDAATLLERHPGGTTVELPSEPRPKLRDIHTSVGAGLRIIVPGVAIPAIKADLGYGIDVRSFALTVSIAGGT